MNPHDDENQEQIPDYRDSTKIENESQLNQGVQQVQQFTQDIDNQQQQPPQDGQPKQVQTDSHNADQPANDDIKQENEEDRRSVFVQNVDYGTTKDELRNHFAECGEAELITIMKGFAYIKFKDKNSVEEALTLSDSELRGRVIKVLPKRTNIRNFKPSTRRRGRFHRGYRYPNAFPISPYQHINQYMLPHMLPGRRFRGGYNRFM